METQNQVNQQQGPSGLHVTTAADAERLETLAQRVCSLGRIMEDISLGYVPEEETRRFDLVGSIGSIVREAGAEIAAIEERLDFRRIDDEDEKIIRLQAFLEEEDGANEVDDTMAGVEEAGSIRKKGVEIK